MYDDVIMKLHSLDETVLLRRKKKKEEKKGKKQTACIGKKKEFLKYRLTDISIIG